jgi:hypothetical protein
VPLPQAEKGHATAFRDGVNKSSQQLSVSQLVKGMLDAGLSKIPLQKQSTGNEHPVPFKEIL